MLASELTIMDTSLQHWQAHWMMQWGTVIMIV